MKQQMNEQRQRTQTTRKQRVTSVSYLKILTFVQEISSLIKGRKFLRNTHYTPHEAFCKMKEENCMNKQPWQTWVWTSRWHQNICQSWKMGCSGQACSGSRVCVFGAEPSSADPFRNNSDIKESTLWGINRSPEPALLLPGTSLTCLHAERKLYKNQKKRATRLLQMALGNPKWFQICRCYHSFGQIIESWLGCKRNIKYYTVCCNFLSELMVCEIYKELPTFFSLPASRPPFFFTEETW